MADSQEPSYKGRSLSQWLGDIQPGQVTGANAPEGAVRAMGTNAIPTLLKWISYEHSASKRASQTEPVEPPSDPRHNPLMSAEERARRAVYAFRFLGAVARPAIPELTQLARRSSDPDRADRCAEALACIRPESLPSLLSLATNGPPMTRWYAIAALEYFAGDPSAVPAVPVLIKCLGDKNDNVANKAGDVLGRLGLPAVEVPALKNALRSPSARTRKWAAWCLSSFDEEAVSTVPALRAAMRDRNYEVRVAATNALRGMGGWEMVGQEWVLRFGSTNSWHGITSDFFTNAPSR